MNNTTTDRDNYIPVLTIRGRPLAPCHPHRARSLVRAGKASFRHRKGIRCIILHRTNIPKVKQASKLQLRIDPGSRTTGIAITRDHHDSSREALLGIEIKHRGKAISNALTDRGKKRRNRRYRKTRFRKPRFLNRTKPAGWLPPSLTSRWTNTLTWVRRLGKLLPITAVHVETNTFDPQLLRNPDIRGRQYQKGPLYRTNLRAAVLQRDGNRCSYCGRSGKSQPLEIDHVIPESKGGSHRFDNRVAACTKCNRKKDNHPLEAFLHRRPRKLAEIQAKLGQDLADPTHMNTIIPRLLTELKKDGWEVTRHSAATTAAGRKTCSVEKTHSNDAALTGCPQAITYLPDQPITVKATGRGGYRRAMTDRSGTPKGKKYRQYRRLPKHEQRLQPAPSHKKRAKRVGNVATGDHVRFMHQGVPVQGRGTISKKGVAINDPNWKSTKVELATVVQRNHGYQVTYPTPSANGTKP